jgi:hypothetical protein
MTTLYKKHIDNFLSNFHENIEFIYGGITENTFEERKTQHIKDKQPTMCNSSWIISNKSITTINIKDINKLDNYKNLIAEVEQYLINELNKKYGNKCKNDRNRDGTISQRGGAGVQLNNLQLNDAVKFYIFYKLQ